MKVFKILLLLFPVFILILYSCTKIDAPYAEARPVIIKDTTMNWDTIPAVRRVLLEDYTGHKCVNCPEAAITARSLEEQYEGQLIVMAVHAGVWALPSSTGEYTLDLRTTTGNDWNSEFPISGYPSGLVNRKEFESSVVVGPDKWGNCIQQIISLPPVVQMKVSNKYDATSRTVNSTVFSRFINPLTGTYMLTVCILEDSIIGAQKNSNPIYPHPDWYNYVFNDVLRGSLNGTWGEVLTASPDTSLTYLGRLSSVIDTSFVARNCWILAFVSDSATKEIIQVEKKKIIP